MRMLARGARVGLTAVAVFTGSLTLAGPANAASSPIEACGGGSYHEIDHHDIDGARIDLLYNGKTNCVVTWKTKYVGKKTFVSALVSTGSNRVKSDPGQYEFYAGPVKLDAAGQCIRWAGGAGPGTGATDVWFSQPGHCG